jgi:hypothetical protein
MERAEHQCDVKSDGNGGTEVDILFEICETSGRYCSKSQNVRSHPLHVVDVVAYRIPDAHLGTWYCRL